MGNANRFVKLFLQLTLLVASVCAGPKAGALCINNDCGPVTVIGNYPVAETQTIMAIYGADISYASPDSIASEGELIAVINSMSPDVRCNPLADSDTKSVVAGSDQLSKYLAAQQLFRAIMAQVGWTSLNNIIGILPRKPYAGGTMKPVWVTTWSDGSSSAFFVSPGTPPQFLDVQPPNSETPPTNSGTCPV